MIAPDVAVRTKAPALLLDRLRSWKGDPDSLEELLPGIKALGPAARDAVPILREACRKPEVTLYPSLLAHIEECVERIQEEQNSSK